MAVERRFVIASSLARLIQRDSAAPQRIVEGHFPARSGRSQFVRVEPDRALLVLLTGRGDGPAAEEAVEVPRAHAEALVTVATGTLTFDRVLVPFGDEIDAVVDRIVLPQSVDVLTVTIRSDPRTFAPPLWVGSEITGDPRFEASGLALNGIPSSETPDVSNAAIEALLDTLERRGSYRSRPRLAQHHGLPHEPTPAPVANQQDLGMAEPLRNGDGPADGGSSAVTTPHHLAVPESFQGAQQIAPASMFPNSSGTVLSSGSVLELDDEIARLARSIGSRGQRSS